MNEIGKMGGQRRDFSNPMEVLGDCHRRIERFLGVLNEAANASGRPLTAEEDDVLQRVSRFFQQAGVRHVQDEEESLFPRLQKKSGAAVEAVIAQCTALETDHHSADQLHTEVDRIIDLWRAQNGLSPTDAQTFRTAVDGLLAIYEPHIAYEDSMVFPLCSQVFTAEELNEIGQEMAARRSR
ncbi:MAG: hemerythrin domain-containing protein [Myxococcales bacterium]|nr:hemerythrin domain-containing protein [Myxococcales bacterium]